MSIKIDQIIRSKRASIGLEVNAKAHLIVRAPLGASEKTIQKVIEEKALWIQKAKLKMEQKLQNFESKKFTSGEKFLYLGKEYPLEIGNFYKMPLDLKEAFQLSRRYEQNASEVFLHWYKRKAMQKIGERARFFYALTGLKYSQIKINSAQTRWGSCAHSGNLNFSWRLIMAPEAVIDYVVVHELVHLEEKNHSANFWNKVKKILPEYSEHKKWLQDNGYLLRF